MNDSTYNLKDGKYTTCDAEHPHFYLQMTKAKVLSNKKIVTGPAYLVVEDLPIYFLFIPFGFFPNSPKYSSGFLMPTYGMKLTGDSSCVIWDITGLPMIILMLR